MADSEKIKAEGEKAARLLIAQAEAEATQMHAEATARGLRAVAEAIQAPGGKNSMTQSLAEQYVAQLGEMSKQSKMIIVPDKPNDVSGVVATALSIGSSITG